MQSPNRLASSSVASPLSRTSAFGSYGRRSEGLDLTHSERLSSHAGGRLRALAASEPTYAPDPSYLATVQRHGMTESWRAKITSWYGELGESFDMRPETVAVATNYLDRYLSRRSCESVDLQLAATASVFLASKVEEQKHFRTGDLVALCGGLFTRSDLRLMELELMMTLGWLLNPPTIAAHVYHLAALLPSDLIGDRRRRRVRDHALAHAERARGDYAFLRFPPSLAAVAAVVCGLKAVDAPRAATEAFVARVDALELPYQRDPAAPQNVQDCALLFLEEPGAARDPMDQLDAEVRDLVAADDPALDDVEAFPAHGAPSPTDIAATDRIQAAELEAAPSPAKKARVR